MPIQFNTGIFTVSLDFELIWGTLDLPHYRRMLPLCLTERQEVVGRLLDLFAEFEISATWCTVGHLFLDRCDHCGRRHPEIIRSSAYDAIRLGRDPGTSEEQDPAFYGRQLIRMIRDCRVPQEIGSHGFSHIMFGDPACSRGTAEAELETALAAAHDLGIEMRSFAFPRNRIGHTGLLAKYGFTSYRGQDENPYESVKDRRWYHRAMHLADVLAAGQPPAVLPIWDEAGIWMIPGSMLYTPSYGIRQWIPMRLRVLRAEKGLLEAARSQRIFHLWFHPTDLVIRKDAMLHGLRQIFQIAAQLRERGRLEFLSMDQVTQRLPDMSNQEAAVSLEEVSS